MAILRPIDINRFLASVAQGPSLILIHGPDESLIRNRAQAITNAVLGPDFDPMQLIDLDAETLNADPYRLLDEANTISMFGGRRIIHVHHAGRLSKTVWQPLLDGPLIDSVILFLGDDMAKSAPLRMAAENSAKSTTIACYQPSTTDMLALFDKECNAAGLTPTSSARMILSELLGPDYGINESEIAKLLIYCHGKLAVEASDVELIVADSIDAGGFDPVDSAFDGNIALAEQSAFRAFRNGVNPSALISLALGHAFCLRRLVEATQNGRLDAALQGERIFFKRQEKVRRQTRLWGQQRLIRAVSVLTQAQHAMRLASNLAEAITIRALWSVAMATKRE